MNSQILFMSAGILSLESGFGSKAIETASSTASSLTGNLGILGIGIALVIAAILVMVFLKKIIINSVLGLIAWAIAVFVFKIQLPFWISLIASALFGLAGIGVMLLLKFAGVNF